jgi:transcriptional regulator with XRE-family HTH domain
MRTKFGLLLREIREQNNLNITDLACKLGVSASYVSCVERKKRNISENFIKKILKCDLIFKDKQKENLLLSSLENIKVFKIVVEQGNPNRQRLISFFKKNINTLNNSQIDILFNCITNECLDANN